MHHYHNIHYTQNQNQKSHVHVHVQTGNKTGFNHITQKIRRKISTKSSNKRHSHAKILCEKENRIDAMRHKPESQDGSIGQIDNEASSHSPERTPPASARGICLTIMAAVVRQMPTPAALLAGRVDKWGFTVASCLSREGRCHIRV